MVKSQGRHSKISLGNPGLEHPTNETPLEVMEGVVYCRLVMNTDLAALTHDLLVVPTLMYRLFSRRIQVSTRITAISGHDLILGSSLSVYPTSLAGIAFLVSMMRPEYSSFSKSD
ncbi:hypothetical protein EVAR_31601_1 [Eumeta japonica]|uniref:Uncharacterized protein n=1 Tax=Eumeta variegata TaxID=151549 RepID=A0A4C1W210_EUMVA|nr:hypothetical protein EVAR_31601_1 [Eumeta japonica]